MERGPVKHQGAVRLEAETKTKSATSMTANPRRGHQNMLIITTNKEVVYIKVGKPWHLISDHHEDFCFQETETILQTTLTSPLPRGQCWIALLLTVTRYVTRLQPLKSNLLHYSITFWEK